MGFTTLLNAGAHVLNCTLTFPRTSANRIMRKWYVNALPGRCLDTNITWKGRRSNIPVYIFQYFDKQSGTLQSPVGDHTVHKASKNTYHFPAKSKATPICASRCTVSNCLNWGCHNFCEDSMKAFEIRDPKWSNHWIDQRRRDRHIVANIRHTGAIVGYSVNFMWYKIIRWTCGTFGVPKKWNGILHSF